MYHLISHVLECRWVTHFVTYPTWPPLFIVAQLCCSYFKISSCPATLFQFENPVLHRSVIPIHPFLVKNASFSSVKCTKPENVRLDNSKRRTLSLVWDYPRNMGDYTKLLLYKILHAADGCNTNKVKFDWDTLNGSEWDFLVTRCKAILLLLWLVTLPWTCVQNIFCFELRFVDLSFR